MASKLVEVWKFLFVEIWKTSEDANFPKPSYKYFKAADKCKYINSFFVLPFLDN